MKPEQEQALREYLQEAIVPLIEQVLVKKLGQAMTYAAEELVQPRATPDALRTEYERGFIDGMQKQMQSSVDKAVNAIAQQRARREEND